MRNDDNSGSLYLLEQPESRPVGDAIVWLKHALSMLGGKLLQWILATVLMIVCIIVISVMLMLVLEKLRSGEAFRHGEIWAWTWTWAVALIVLLIISMLPLVFSAGFVSIAAGVAEDDEFVYSRLFAGFDEQLRKLVKLALFWLIPAFALGMLLSMLMDITKLGGSLWVILPIALLFLLCNWMVLPLIMLQGVSPLNAIWMSLVGSLKNIVPLTGFVVAMLLVVFGIWKVAVTEFASFTQYDVNIPLVLFGLVFYPALFAVFPIISYVSYRNIWTSAPLE